MTIAIAHHLAQVLGDVFVPSPHLPLSSRDVQRRFWGFLPCSAVTSILLLSGCGSFSAGSKNADGVQFYQQGQYQAAIEKFQEAANANPTDPDAAYNLGRVYHRLAALNGDSKAAVQAEQYYRMAIDRDANHVEAHRALAVFYVEQGESNKAFALLGDWATRSPNVADPRIELARLHEEFGDKDAAEEQLLAAYGIDRENPRTLAALGRHREEAGDYAQAMENYSRSFELDRFQPEVASRITALQSAVSTTAPYPTAGGDTRMVTSGTPVQR